MLLFSVREFAFATLSWLRRAEATEEMLYLVLIFEIQVLVPKYFTELGLTACLVMCVFVLACSYAMSLF